MWKRLFFFSENNIAWFSNLSKLYEILSGNAAVGDCSGRHSFRILAVSQREAEEVLWYHPCSLSSSSFFLLFLVSYKKSHPWVHLFAETLNKSLTRLVPFPYEHFPLYWSFVIFKTVICLISGWRYWSDLFAPILRLQCNLPDKCNTSFLNSSNDCYWVVDPQ